MAHDEELQSIKEALDRAASAVERKEFRDLGKVFEGALRSLREISHAERQDLWARYQELWDRRKVFMSTGSEKSSATKERYLSELATLDYSYDGLPVFQGFANYERVGDKIRACRARIKEMQAELKNDNSLLPQDRRTVQEKVQSAWSGIKSSEETTFIVHGERADQIVEEAVQAVDTLPPGQAAAVLKAKGAEFKSLWLPQKKRELVHGVFDDLWAKLQFRRAEGKRKHEDWVTRQREGLEKLRAAREKTWESMKRIKANIEANEERLAGARSEEYTARVSGWIEEDRQKLRDREESCEELDRKIRDAEDKLKDD